MRPTPQHDGRLNHFVIIYGSRRRRARDRLSMASSQFHSFLQRHIDFSFLLCLALEGLQAKVSPKSEIKQQLIHTCH
jgi:hypothetical protein